MDKRALKPEVFIAGLPVLAKANEAEKKGATEEELQIATLAASAGWKILKKFIDRLEEDLDNKNALAIAEGKGLEEIGLNTVVINLTKSVIKKIVDKVNDAQEICERRE